MLRTGFLVAGLLAALGGAAAPPGQEHAPFTLEEYLRRFRATGADGVRDCREEPPRAPYLLPVPRLRALPERDATAEDERRIRASISALREVSDSRAAEAGTWPDGLFPPLWNRLGQLTLHRSPPPAALGHLVELGPKALPFLIEHLGDETPTGIEVLHSGEFGGMWHERRIAGNPFQPREREILGPEVVGPPVVTDRGHVARYRATVGDLCFVALGHITNRKYAALAYQPTLCMVIGSPTSDRDLERMMTELWEGRADAQGLLDSLLLDYSTRDRKLREVHLRAAQRLAYYFPDESAALIAARIDSLVWTDDWDANDRINGLTPAALMRAVNFSPRPEIQTALLRMIERRPSEKAGACCFADAGPWKDDPVFAKLAEMVGHLPREGVEPQGWGLRLLHLAAHKRPARLRELVDLFLGASDAFERRLTTCYLLQEVSPLPPWSAEVLRPWLDDDARVGDFYAEVPKSQERVHPILLRYEAARALRRLEGAPPFVLAGTPAEVEAQVAALRCWLDAR